MGGGVTPVTAAVLVFEAARGERLGGWCDEKGAVCVLGESPSPWDLEKCLHLPR